MSDAGISCGVVVVEPPIAVIELADDLGFVAILDIAFGAHLGLEGIAATTRRDQ